MSDEQVQSSLQGALGPLGRILLVTTQLAKQSCIQVSLSLAIGSITGKRPPWSCWKVIGFMITYVFFFWNKFESHIFKNKGMTTVDVWWTGPSNRVLSVSRTEGFICGCPRVRGVGRAGLVPQMQGSHCPVCILQEGVTPFSSPFLTDSALTFKSIR